MIKSCHSRQLYPVMVANCQGVNLIATATVAQDCKNDNVAWEASA